MMNKKVLLFTVILLLGFMISNTKLNPVRAASFLSNDNITRVTLKVLSCDDEKDPQKREKCKSKKSDPEKPNQKLVPVILSDSANHSNNPILEFIDSVWRLFISSPESK